METENGMLEQLQAELKQEALSRRLQEELNNKLQDEYDVLLKRLAEAELHIDRMRFSSSMELNKYFIVRHQSEQHATLRERLEAQFDPAWRSAFMRQGGDSTADSAAPKAALKSTGVCTESGTLEEESFISNSSHVKDGDKFPEENEDVGPKGGSPPGVAGSSDSQENTSVATEAVVKADGSYLPLSPKNSNTSMDGARKLTKEGETEPHGVLDRRRSSSYLSRCGDSSVSVLDTSSLVSFSHHQSRDGVIGRPRSESQELLLHSSKDSSHSSSITRPHINSTHSHASSFFTESDDTSFSQLSTSAAECRSSAESMQLAQLFKVHNLQEEVAGLKLKLNDGDVPLDKILEDLHQIHQEHHQLSRDVDASSAQLNSLRTKYSSKASSHADKTKRAVRNELVNLAGQLQDLYDLLQVRASHEEQPSNIHSAISSCEQLLKKRDSDSRLSNTFYDSLNSPCLPSKYLNEDASSESEFRSPQGLPLHQAAATASLTNGLPPSSHSTPIESNGSSSLTNGNKTRRGNKQPSTDMGHSRRQNMNDDKSVDGSDHNGMELSENGRRGGEAGDKDEQFDKVESSVTVMDEMNNGSAKHRKRDTQSDVTDVSLSDEHLDLTDEMSILSNKNDDYSLTSDHSDEDRGPNLMRSPDSHHLHEAKKNLKKAKKLVYGGDVINRGNDVINGNGYGSSCRSLSRQSSEGSEIRASVQASTTSSATFDENRDITLNDRSLYVEEDRGTESTTTVPRLLQSQHSPHTRTTGSSPSREQMANSSGATLTTKDQSHMTFPGLADSGFAGSEFPSRMATRMDTTTGAASAERERQLSTLTSSTIQSSFCEDDVDRQKFMEATAAIEALRRELSDLKEHMMRNTKQQDEGTGTLPYSIPHTPSSHSHSTEVQQCQPSTASFHDTSSRHPEGRNSSATTSLPPHPPFHQTPSRQSSAGSRSSSSTVKPNLHSLKLSQHSIVSAGQSSLEHTPLPSSCSLTTNSSSHQSLTNESSAATISHSQRVTNGGSVESFRSSSTILASTPSRSTLPISRQSLAKGRGLSSRQSTSVLDDKSSVARGELSQTSTSSTSGTGTPSRSITSSQLQSFVGSRASQSVATISTNTPSHSLKESNNYLTKLTSTPPHSMTSSRHAVVSGQSALLVPTTMATNTAASGLIPSFYVHTSSTVSSPIDGKSLRASTTDLPHMLDDPAHVLSSSHDSVRSSQPPSATPATNNNSNTTSRAMMSSRQSLASTNGRSSRLPMTTPTESAHDPASSSPAHLSGRRSSPPPLFSSFPTATMPRSMMSSLSRAPREQSSRHSSDTYTLQSSPSHVPPSSTHSIHSIAANKQQTSKPTAANPHVLTSLEHGSISSSEQSHFGVQLSPQNFVQSRSSLEYASSTNGQIVRRSSASTAAARTMTSRVDATSHSNDTTPSRNPSSVCLSTPALSDAAHSMPLPTPEHMAVHVSDQTVEPVVQPSSCSCCNRLSNHSSGFVQVSDFGTDPPSMVEHGRLDDDSTRDIPRRPGSAECSERRGYPLEGRGYPLEGQGYPSERQAYPSERQGYPSERQGYPSWPGSLREAQSSRSYGGFDGVATADHYRPPSEHSDTKDSGLDVRSECTNATCGSAPVISTVATPSHREHADKFTGVGDGGLSMHPMCLHCANGATNGFRDGSRFSDGTMSHDTDPVYNYSSNERGSSFQKPRTTRPIGNGYARVGMDNPAAVKRGTPVQLTQPDQRGAGHERKWSDLELPKPVSFDGAQRPIAASTPSRMNVATPTTGLRPCRPQTPRETRENVDGRFKLSKNFENGVASPFPRSIPAAESGSTHQSNGPTHQSNMYPTSKNPRRYPSSDDVVYSPKRKRGPELHASRALDSPRYSCSHVVVQGSTSDAYSSVQSSPAGRYYYSDTRRASSPVLLANTHRVGRKAYGERPPAGQKHHVNRERDSESSTDSDSEKESDFQERGLPLAHVTSTAAGVAGTNHMSTRSKRCKTLQRCCEHASDSSSEHHSHACTHGQPRVVKVVKTPRHSSKRQVVYLATSPEEVYFSEPGQSTSKSTRSQQRRKVIGVARGASTLRRNMRRGERSEVSRVRGMRRRRMCGEPTVPVKEVYVVDREEDVSGSDLEPVESLERCDVDLEDTLRLAKELKRRTKRLKGTLQSELERQRFY